MWRKSQSVAFIPLLSRRVPVNILDNFRGFERTFFRITAWLLGTCLTALFVFFVHLSKMRFDLALSKNEGNQQGKQSCNDHSSNDQNRRVRVQLCLVVESSDGRHAIVNLNFMTRRDFSKNIIEVCHIIIYRHFHPNPTLWL